MVVVVVVVELWLWWLGWLWSPVLWCVVVWEGVETHRCFAIRERLVPEA